MRIFTGGEEKLIDVLSFVSCVELKSFPLV